MGHVGLKEIWYFGIEYVDNSGARNWLKLNRKVIVYVLVSLFPLTLQIAIDYRFTSSFQWEYFSDNFLPDQRASFNIALNFFP